MTKTTHTPGPWISKDKETGKYLAASSGWHANFEPDYMGEAEEDAGDYEGVTSSTVIMTEDKSRGVALVVGFGFDDENISANAHLIEAAPEMYDLLIDSESSLLEAGLVGENNAIRALINRINGENR